MRVKASAAVEKYHRSKPAPVRVMRDGREICNQTHRGRAEYLLRTFIMAKRQKGICALCCDPLGEDVTFDHQRGRGMSGGYRDDRIVIDGKWHNAAVHWKCNGAKGSRKFEWINGRYLPVVSE